MVNTALNWQQAAVVGVVLAIATAISARSRIRPVAAFFREATIIAALYSLWQYAGAHAVTDTAGAFARARAVVRLEHSWHLPAEAAVQRPWLHHRLGLQLANLYYDTFHFTGTFVFLLWLFLRHRQRYAPVRNILAGTTAACLIVQVLPVAPPRLLPGFVDTATQYGQSVYGGAIGADQLSAMPSVHVAWALVVGFGIVYATTGRWRWLALGYPALTWYVVVITANHFWLDGLVAALLFAAVVGLYAARGRAHRVRSSGETTIPDQTPVAAALD